MKYFTIEELSRSATATAQGINNTPTREVVANLTELVDKVLDPLREAWGGPITVTSGYRSPALNKAVKGATNSQHIRGEAADITVGSRAANARLHALIQSLGLPYDQLIWEKGTDAGPDWVHVSHGPPNRKQLLRL